MKGLLFTLLNHMAESAGCSDEAWELVMEFAAAETLVGDEEQEDLWTQPTDAVRPDLFDVPAEAMLNCLCRERRGLTPEEWENLEPETRFRLSGSGDIATHLPRMVATGSCGFRVNAFQTQLEARDVLSDEEWDEDDETLDAEWNRYPRVSTPPGPKDS